MLNGTRQRFAGFSQPRQCREEVLRTFRHRRAAGARRWRHSPAHQDELALGAGVADHGVIRKYARRRRQVADVSVHHAKEVPDGFLVDGNMIEISHSTKP
jgi:hypothetical protein